MLQAINSFEIPSPPDNDEGNLLPVPQILPYNECPNPSPACNVAATSLRNCAKLLPHGYTAVLQTRSGEPDHVTVNTGQTTFVLAHFVPGMNILGKIGSKPKKDPRMRTFVHAINATIRNNGNFMGNYAQPPAAPPQPPPSAADWLIRNDYYAGLRKDAFLFDGEFDALTELLKKNHDTLFRHASIIVQTKNPTTRQTFKAYKWENVMAICKRTSIPGDSSVLIEGGNDYVAVADAGVACPPEIDRQYVMSTEFGAEYITVRVQMDYWLPVRQVVSDLSLTQKGFVLMCDTPVCLNKQ